MNTIKLQTTKEKLLDLYNHVKENYQYIKEDTVYALSEFNAEYVSSMVYLDWYSGNRFIFEFNSYAKPIAVTIVDLRLYDFEILSEFAYTSKSSYSGEKPTNIIMLTISE